jgi:Flp pilus assembly protein TadG
MIRKFRFYWKNKQGLAAVEFAFVLPILLTMLLGLVELSQALLLRTDVANMSATAADLIAEESSVASTDLTNVYNALNAMLFPFATGPATITITSVIDGGTGNAPKVAWSCTQNGTAETKGAAPSTAIPTGLITAGDGTSVVWAKITYAYVSPISYFLIGTKNWTNNFYLKPRRVLQVPVTGTPSGCNT